jgi:hypothetical protein
MQGGVSPVSAGEVTAISQIREWMTLSKGLGEAVKRRGSRDRRRSLQLENARRP